MLRCVPVLVAMLFPCGIGASPPPFTGTVHIAPQLITSADPTRFASLLHIGRGLRYVYDRRVGWTAIDAWLFRANYAHGRSIEVIVNPEYASAALAEVDARYYAEAVGRLPRSLLRDVDALWIHRGNHYFGGGNRSILIHTGSIAAGYIAQGTLEETLAHEAVHTSLDAQHAAAPGWLAARAADGNRYISTYAAQNPATEDVAESFVPYLVVCCARARVAPTLVATIESTIPHRLAYFEALDLVFDPLRHEERVFRAGFEDFAP